MGFTVLRYANPAVVGVVTLVVLALGPIAKFTLGRPAQASSKGIQRAVLLVLLPLSYAVLVWVCLLGGWQVLV